MMNIEMLGETIIPVRQDMEFDSELESEIQVDGFEGEFEFDSRIETSI